MSIRNDNQDCINLSTYGKGGIALRIIANTSGGGAIESYGRISSVNVNTKSGMLPAYCGLDVFHQEVVYLIDGEMDAMFLVLTELIRVTMFFGMN